jgi:hypothetical protein
MNLPMADTSVSMRPPRRLSISSSRVTRRRSAARDFSAISGDAIAEVGELHGEVAQAGSSLVDLALRARQRPGIPRGPCGAFSHACRYALNAFKAFVAGHRRVMALVFQ